MVIHLHNSSWRDDLRDLADNVISRIYILSVACGALNYFVAYFAPSSWIARASYEWREVTCKQCKRTLLFKEQQNKPQNLMKAWQQQQETNLNISRVVTPAQTAITALWRALASRRM